MVPAPSNPPCPCYWRSGRPARFEPPAAHRGNAVDLCFDKVVRKCTSFVIACEACGTEIRGGGPCLADLTQEEMIARKTQRLPLEVRKSIAFLRIWVRAAPPPLAPHTCTPQ